MPLDGICMQAVAEELRPELLGLRIDKVQQPARDQVILLLRGNKRLLLNAGANTPRIQLTALTRDNPAEPPMFCMLLRKHLVGGRVAAVTQPPLERLVRLELDVTDDFGQPGRRTLVLEAMGRRSNLILLDGEGRIIDCLRRVDADMSAARQVLPGLYYEPPASVGRLPVTEETENGFREKISAANPERSVDAFLLDHYFGISPLIARELAFRSAGETDAHLFDLGAVGEDRLWKELSGLIRAIQENHFTPICLKKDGKMADFTYCPIAQYGPAMETVRYDTFSTLMDDFYALREQQERVRQRGADLLRTATTARDRIRRKLAMQEKDYAATQNRDQLRIYGDLITANLYRMERGAARLETENFYDPECRPVAIPLDPLLTPQQNAAKYYKHQGQDGGEVSGGADGPCPPGPGLSGECAGGVEPGRDGTGLFGHPRRAAGRGLPPPTGKKGTEPACKASGVPHHLRLPGAGGAEQPPERQADPQRGPPGHLAPYPEDPRFPRDPLHRRP